MYMLVDAELVALHYRAASSRVVVAQARHSQVEPPINFLELSDEYSCSINAGERQSWAGCDRDDIIAGAPKRYGGGNVTSNLIPSLTLNLQIPPSSLAFPE